MNLYKIIVCTYIFLQNHISCFINIPVKKNEICAIMDNKQSSLFIDDKKLITISPGGFKGFYLLGILTYIKETYNTDNLIYSGASAGAWNGLFMCYKGDSLSFVYNLLGSDIKKAKSINEIEYFMKYKLLSSYKNEDFDFSRLFIGVTTFQGFTPSINIFSDFKTLEDAINCCIASSHIPLLTGGLTNKYQNVNSFDGGFSKYPYVNKKPILHVSPSMWEETDITTKNAIELSFSYIQKYYQIFSLYKTSLIELYDDGYHDAKKYKKILDSTFLECI